MSTVTVPVLIDSMGAGQQLRRLRVLFGNDMVILEEEETPCRIQLTRAAWNALVRGVSLEEPAP